ncbi:hypothetical protein Tdes44962_MAKER05297 [Teratosphaeria destructans]|uniref:Uncharacterized protein n=1 Tax=Teratosphaeria destructans TaxID=418781 RepID=A0A9W7VZB8_9PEZI|nr:hypothetical protein Tdes44962_MAKER05297 [Teratosphaeria destructans]
MQLNWASKEACERYGQEAEWQGYQHNKCNKYGEGISRCDFHAKCYELYKEKYTYAPPTRYIARCSNRV